MKINFRGTRIPLETDTLVWGEKIPYTDIVVEDDKNVNESFLKEEFLPHLQRAIDLLGIDNGMVTEIAKKGTERDDLQIKKAITIVVNFDTDQVYYDYYFDVGDLFGGFLVHLKSTPEGQLNYVGVS